MDKPISVGDLAVVTKANPCGCPDRLGLVLKVEELRPAWSEFRKCYSCGAVRNDAYGQVYAIFNDDDTVNLFRLQRIPPLDELEGEKRDEKLKDDIRGLGVRQMSDLRSTS